MKIVSNRIRACGWTLILLAAASLGWASEVYTNPLNRDPLVREGYQHFYNLDYPGAVARFERFQAEHPGDPQATVLLLEAVVFQELYRLDLLDTTFYANDGFLSGKHATVEDPQARDRIFALADEAVREADGRLSKNPNDVNALYARGWERRPFALPEKSRNARPSCPLVGYIWRIHCTNCVVHKRHMAR